MNSDYSARLDLIVLHSRDIEKSRSFYSILLGVDFTKEKHDKGHEHYSCTLDGLVIEIYPVNKEIAQPDSLGFAVTNLNKVIERIGNNYVHRPPMRTGYGRRAVIKDPDNRLVHLVEK